MLFELYIITTLLSSLYIFITSARGAVAIDPDRKVLDIFMLCFIVFILNWIVTPAVILDISKELKK